MKKSLNKHESTKTSGMGTAGIEWQSWAIVASLQRNFDRSENANQFSTEMQLFNNSVFAALRGCDIAVQCTEHWYE